MAARADEMVVAVFPHLLIAVARAVIGKEAVEVVEYLKSEEDAQRAWYSLWTEDLEIPNVAFALMTVHMIALDERPLIPQPFDAFVVKSCWAAPKAIVADDDYAA